MVLDSLPWYYLPDLEGDLHLSGEEWHHARNVLRLQVGSDVILFDGRGTALKATLRSSGRNEGVFSKIADVSTSFPSEKAGLIKLAFALTRNADRNAFAIEKAVELGVSEIILLDCAHGEKHTTNVERLKKIIVSAAKQSRKLNLPILQGPVAPHDIVPEIQTSDPKIRILCCHPGEEIDHIEIKYSPGAKALLLIGPEGGFSQQELEYLKQMEIPIVSLGPYRLRVETAVLAAIQSIHVLNHLHKLT